jgi:hypothetical protein
MNVKTEITPPVNRESEKPTFPLVPDSSLNFGSDSLKLVEEIKATSVGNDIIALHGMTHQLNNGENTSIDLMQTQINRVRNSLKKAELDSMLLKSSGKTLAEVVAENADNLHRLKAILNYYDETMPIDQLPFCVATPDELKDIAMKVVADAATVKAAFGKTGANK